MNQLDRDVFLVSRFSQPLFVRWQRVRYYGGGEVAGRAVLSNTLLDLI